MKRYGLLLVAMVVSLSLFSACRGEDDIVNVDGEGSNVVSDSGDDDASQSGEDAASQNDDAGTRNVNRAVSSNASTLAIEAALENFEDEFMQRLETTPFHVFPLLAGTLENGTTNVDFTYIDEWRGEDAGMTVTAKILSKLEDLEFAIRGDIAFSGMNIDFSSYLNEERLAVSSSYLGGEYYGIVFETFMDDMSGLWEEMGLDVSELRIFNEIIDQLNRLESLEGMEELEEELMRILFEFLANAEQVPEVVDGVTRIAYTITMQEFADFLRVLYIDTLFADASILEIYNIPFISAAISGGVSGAAMESFIYDAFEEMLSELEDIDCDVTMAFYIGQGDRLTKIEIYGTIAVYDDELSEFSLTFDFGTSATDKWEIIATANDGWDTYTLRMDWEIKAGANNVHEISMSVNGINMGTLISDWNTSSGDFVFAGIFNRQRQDFFGGNLLVSGDTFKFSFEHIVEYNDDWREGFSIAISTEHGANIGNVNFINIGELSYADFEAITANIMMDMMGFGDMGVWDADIDWENFDWDSIDMSLFEFE